MSAYRTLTFHGLRTGSPAVVAFAPPWRLLSAQVPAEAPRAPRAASDAGRPARRDAAMAGVVALGLLAGYFGIYAITGNDFTWQLQTSLGRLLVQVWPLVLLAAFVTLREPQRAERAAAPLKKQRTASR